MKYSIVLLLLFCSARLFSQSATYKLINKKTGAYSNIAIRQTGDQLEVNILANWNDKTGTYGEFNSKGVLVNNKCILKGGKDAAICSVSLDFTDESTRDLQSGHSNEDANDSLTDKKKISADKKLAVDFQDCSSDQLTSAFSGIYTKIADEVPGEYTATADLSYFYSKPDDKTRKKSFIDKSEILNVEELFEGGWGFATSMSEGKHNFGYVKLSDLKLKKTYLFD